MTGVVDSGVDFTVTRQGGQLILCASFSPGLLPNVRFGLTRLPQLTANGGFFFTNMFSFFQPYALSLTTPTELLPYGWTTTDLWCAPLITGLYAFLTHAQPFWADAHSVALGWLGTSSGAEKIAAVDPETARAACAVVLATLFSTRAAKNFAPTATKPKTKVQ